MLLSSATSNWPAPVGQSCIRVVCTRRAGPARREPVEFLRLIMLVCFRSHATDIHVEPWGDYATMRLRIDGSMVDVGKLPGAVRRSIDQPGQSALRHRHRP